MTAGGDSAAEVHARLLQAEETLRAIRSGEVDALVVQDESPAAQVFTLSSADRPYRLFVENMRDGAATVSESGTILYANGRLGELLADPLHRLIGSPITTFVARRDRDALRAISGRSGGIIEINLVRSDQRTVPVRVSASTLDVDAVHLLCLTFADLSEQNAQNLEINRLRLAQEARMFELEHAQKALTQQATHDPLTGLPNRRLLMDRVTQVLAITERSKLLTGLIFVDLDSFKAVNDTYGHAAGDTVLRQVAGRLNEVVRPTDSVSRLGGDEFVVLLPALESASNANVVAARIAESIGLPIKLEYASANVTASIGVAVFDPAGGGAPDPHRLLQQADVAMYHAKALGGSQTQRFTAASAPTVLEADRESWVSQIRDALDEDRFELCAQPIIELATGDVVQRELLLRMRSSKGELIAPGAFLPTAERCGLIADIDRWVIRKAVELAAHSGPFAVNLSATSAGDRDVLDVIEHELQRHGTDPANLIFEITETAVMQNIDRGKLFAEHLVALGCRFALDDFGTGFASFTYLKHLPVRYLKIDMEFVRELPNSAKDRSVVSAIVALAGGFGQKTIAEGVENELTALLLADLGVDYGQGYLFGRPARLEERAQPPKNSAISRSADSAESEPCTRLRRTSRA